MPEELPQEEAANTAAPIDELFRGGHSIAEALETLRLRLLDLTARNRLLNFRHSAAKTLQFVEGRPSLLYDKLVESVDKRVALTAIPEPRKMEWVERQGRMARPDVRDYAKSLGLSTSFDLSSAEAEGSEQTGLRALLYPEDLERQCRKLARDAKTAMEETGANMLFLILGFLEYPESPGAGKSLLAPLVPVPVELQKGDLERTSGTYRYFVKYTGEELSENLSLREKLKGDFGLELPVFTEESSLQSYYAELARVIQGKPGFAIRMQATLALVSMTKMLLVRDLDPKNWPHIDGVSALTQHAIVRLVFEGRQHDGDGEDGEEYDVDRHKLADLPIIYDADSSQHSALIDAVEGKNLVIEGPPGTGKSQTITNLIASAMSTGKKVLFVAEKLAALQVVKSRLERAGLADFCLELHSNKSSKKDVIEAIATRAGRDYASPAGLDARVSALREKKKALSNYVDLINSRAGNAQGLTVHQVLWKAERYRQGAGKAWIPAQKIKMAQAHELTSAEFNSLFDELSHLSQEHERIGSFREKAPFWGFFPKSLAPGAELEIGKRIEDALEHAQVLRDAYASAAKAVDADALGISKVDARQLGEELAGLAPLCPSGMAQELLPRLFSAVDPHGIMSRKLLQRLEEHQTRAKELQSVFVGVLQPNLRVDEALRTEAEKLVVALNGLGLAGYSAEQLEQLANLIRAAVADAKGALAEIRSLASLAGIEFTASLKSIAAVAVPIELAIACPRDHLHRRAPELMAPGAASIVRDAQRRFASIRDRESELSAVFYLDMAVTEPEVEEALTTLREGVEWWRVFQGRHRRAVALHRRVARVKKVPRPQRRDELETLHGHLREKRLSKQDARYPRAMGPQWAADDTDFDALHLVAAWLETANTRFLEAEVGASAFRPLEITAEQIVALARSADRFEKARGTLDACSLLVESGGLQNARSFVRAFTSNQGWTERLQFLAALEERLSHISQLLKSWAAQSHEAKAVLRALVASNDYDHVVAAVEGDNETRELFGQRFGGMKTDLSPISQAFAYGRAVLELGLAGAIERALLSEEGNAVRTTVLSCLSEIERAWGPVDAFCDFLGEQGEFALNIWTGAEPSEVAFADKFIERLTKAKGATGDLVHWAHYVQAANFAKERGLGDFVRLLEAEIVPREELANAFGYRFYGTIAESLFGKYPALGQFSGLRHDAIRGEFKKLDREVIQLRGREVAAAAAFLARPPIGTSGSRVADKSERTLLDYLIPQARPRMPIRKMMTAAGRAIQEYKPCFMMGPQAVAQYLAPGSMKFDIVVMDEASQLKPEEALGAIARGSQLVVVGDPKQLPPTAFFDKLGETQDEDDQRAQAALMLESILDVCMGHFHPVRTLKWHYRSQHESLIAFSNVRFYRNKLIVFPSPYGQGRNLGVKLRYITGAVYDSGLNVAEANIVVDAVLVHMRIRPEDSLGVVTLNLKQRELIEELLDKKMRDLPHAGEFCEQWSEKGMGFFVKNLENVQGDERDVIFISTTFGPAPGTNVVYQRFGPISRHDGWRRLNVLFTRARKSLTVFTSMRSEDIVDGETVPRGTRELKAYLEYARSGVITQVEGPQGEPDSDFEVAVIEALEKKGYGCTPQLGVAGFRIDIGVKHPAFAGAYMAAIECDGAAYHSGRSARDRDRIRQEILESLGWKGRIYRIWSTDWFRAPAIEMARLFDWLEQIKVRPIDEAYLASTEAQEVPAPKRPAAAKGKAESLQLSLEALGVTIGDQDEPIEVQVGDQVTYELIDDGGKKASIKIGLHTDQPKGVIGHATPLAEALLGLQEGDVGMLTQPDRKPIRMRIVQVKRQAMQTQ